jgi:recombination protein RecA
VAKKLNLDGMDFGDTPRSHQYFPSSIRSLNRAMGSSKGVRGGTIMQLLAEPGHGKTTLALDYVSQAQKLGIKDVSLTIGKTTRLVNALFVDLERTFDTDYAKTIGVDVSKLLVYRPDYAEQCLPQIEYFLNQGIQIVVFDSVPAIVTKDEFEKEVDDPARMAGAANLLSRWIIRLIGPVDNADALFIFINQYRANISPMARSEKKPFGPRSLRYFSRIILDLVKIKNEEEKSHIQATVSKNKQAAEGQKCEYIMLKGKGLAPSYDLMSLALEYDIIQKSGAWYEYQGQKAQGMDNCVLIFDLESLSEKIDKCLEEQLGE